MYRRLRRTLLLCLFAASIPLDAARAAMATPGQFSVSESGAATYLIPLQVPPGTAGLEPKLALTYNSQAGNGLLGMGWSVSGLSAIGRCPRTLAQDGVRGAVNYDMDDRYCLDGQRLIAIQGGDGANATEYRTEHDSFAKVVSYGSAGNGPAWFKVWTKAGQVMEYGNTTDSRIEAQGSSTVRLWAINKISDTNGNYLAVAYTEDSANGDYYPQRIDYTGNAKTGMAPANAVTFSYETRPDPITVYHAGSMIRSVVRMTGVSMSAGKAVKTYRLQYTTSAQTGRSLLGPVTECDGDTAACLPAVALGWSAQPVGFQAQRWETQAGGYWDAQRWFVADANGDGKADLVNIFNDSGSMSVDVHVSTGNGFQAQRWETRAGGYWDAQRWFVADVNGDGKADLVNIFNDNGLMSVDVHVSTGNSFQSQRWETRAGGYWEAQRWFVVDVNGDGKADLVNIFNDNGSMSVNVHVSTGSGFQIQRWATRAGGYWDAQRWFVADVNGDGKADLVNIFNDSGSMSVDVHVSTGNSFQGQRWETRAGGYWDAQRWFVEDVNGDGKADLVNIFNDNSAISINVHVSTGNRFQIQRWETRAGSYGEAQRWFVADVNGDGKADLVKITDASVTFSHSAAYPTYSPQINEMSADVHVNTGNGFRMQRWASGDKDYWNVKRWFVADVKGQGAASLINIFNDNGSMSADSHNAEAPGDLLISINNGLSASFSLSYKPLTDESVYGKEATGSYPVVDLQIPLYVVSSASSPNGIGGTLTSNYKYGGLKADLSGRGLLGFRWVEETQAETGVKSYTEYRQDWPYIGLPQLSKKSLAGAGNGGLLSQASNSLACINPADGSACTTGVGKRYFPYVSQSVESSWDLNGAALPTATTTSQYDRWGNPLDITVSSSDGHSKKTTNAYVNDEANWFLGRLTRSTVTSTAP